MITSKHCVVVVLLAVGVGTVRATAAEEGATPRKPLASETKPAPPADVPLVEVKMAPVPGAAAPFSVAQTIKMVRACVEKPVPIYVEKEKGKTACDSFQILPPSDVPKLTPLLEQAEYRPIVSTEGGVWVFFGNVRATADLKSLALVKALKAANVTLPASVVLSFNEKVLLVYREGKAFYRLDVEKLPPPGQTPPPAREAPAAKRPPDEPVKTTGNESKPPPPEEKAKGLLRMARNYAANGMKSKARTILESLVKEYPDTESAKQAREELQKLP